MNTVAPQPPPPVPSDPTRQAEHWPSLTYERLAPTVDYLTRVVQVAGKYGLDDLFEPGWGNIVLDVAPRGLRTPTFRQGDRLFSVYYRLLDGDAVVETDEQSRSLPLTSGSVARFYEEFCGGVASLGLRPPGSTLLCELPSGLSSFEQDHTERPWDAAAGRLVWQGFALVAEGLRRYQAPYRGHRPRIGVMWGGFDLSSTRYRGVRSVAPTDRPAFLQHGMTEEYVSVGFYYGTQRAPAVSLYAYIAPQPAGMGDRDWRVPGATFVESEGLVVLAWDDLVASPDPLGAIVAFGDAVYAAAVDLAGWPADLVGRRFSGWEASSTPPAEMER